MAHAYASLSLDEPPRLGRLPSSYRGVRVLVTGGCGFIGGWLVRALARAGSVVSVVDDLSTGRVESVQGLPGVELTVGSVLDRPLMMRLGADVDFVFHLAGIVGMRLAMSRAALAHRITVEGTRNVLDATGSAPAVLFSSSAVYGQGREGESAREDWPVRREDLIAYDGAHAGYAAGKWELEVLGARAAATGRRTSCVRPFNVVGVGQSAAYGMVLPRFVDAARAGRPLRVYDDGLQSRCFTDVQAFVEHVLTLGLAPGAYDARAVNVGNPTSVTILDLARMVIAAAGSTSPIEFVPYRDVFPGRRDVRHRRPDVARAEALIGPMSWASIESIVADVVGGSAR